jgi:FlaA1/EpsC-like NDP-sugar epimerase
MPETGKFGILGADLCMSLKGKRILVTGGTGSLGQTLVRRLLSSSEEKPARVTVFSRDEAKQHYMRLALLHRKAATDDIIYENSQQILNFRIGDVRDYPALCAALRETDVVFNAAALTLMLSGLIIWCGRFRKTICRLKPSSEFRPTRLASR